MISLKPIGFVRTQAGVEDFRRGRKRVVSTIEVSREFEDGLEGDDALLPHLRDLLDAQEPEEERLVLRVHPGGVPEEP